MRSLHGALLLLGLISGAARAQATPGDPRAGIAAFNRAFDEATRTMNNGASLALWEDNGVSLLPSTRPIVGKQAITRFFEQVTAPLKGATMTSFDFQCFDITVSGDWASEWCTEHQVVALPGDKPPFDGWGKMLLVLHRGVDGKWRLTHEMWNQAVPGDTLH